MSVIKERASNIELLRIIAMVGVIIMHYNNPSMGGGIKFVLSGSLNQVLIYSLSGIFVCAVNLFVLITGYFMCEKMKITIEKVVLLLVQVIVFSELEYLLEICISNETFSFEVALKEMIPSNWFVTLYITIYLLSPYINGLLNVLTDRALNNLCLLLILLFSVWPTILDVIAEVIKVEYTGLYPTGPYGSSFGYSITNFILMYIIGACLHRGRISQYKKRHLLPLLLINTLLIICWSFINDIIGFSLERSAWEYCNPLVIFEAAIIFILFHNSKIRNFRFINILAEGSFAAYLLHMFFINQLNIEKAVNSNAFFMIIHILITSLVIYIICWVIYIIYKKIFVSSIYFWITKLHLPIVKIEFNRESIGGK